MLGQLGEWQAIHLAGDGLVEPCCGLAGGSGQANTQRRQAKPQLTGLQQGKQAHHGGGLAGAGAAGNHREAAAAGQGAGGFLPVNLGLLLAWKQRVQQRSKALGACRRFQAVVRLA